MPTSRLPLTAPALRRALISGARRVIAGREVLNRINVFPVADGDTGNNLAHTLGSLLNGALSRRSRHIGELLKRIGDDAIDGARGNSGAILAQFLHGVAEHARAQPELDAATLAASVRHGAANARAALAHPVEGTILSVINAFADALDEAAAASADGDPRPGFVNALARARSALARTPQQMALLQRAGVVDAGAQGFVDLLEGIAEFVDAGPRALRLHGAGAAANEPASRPAGRAADPACAAHAHAAGEAAIPALHEAVDPLRRWCSECLLVGEDLRREPLREALEAIGADSLVLAGGGARLRVHAHVGRPQALFDACARFGAVESMKADDMLAQQRSVERAQRVAVITDSAADLPEELAERYGLQVVPVRVSIDGRDYLDKTGLATAEFYRRMAASADLPRTSQPPPGDFRRVFEFLLGHRSDVLYVGLSRAVSGTLQSGEQAAARAGHGDPRRVQVFDTFNAAGGQALLAWRAAELAADGIELAAIVAELERLRPLTLTWAMARDISHAVRGGRIPPWAVPLVRFTGLTPIARIKPEGKLGVSGGVFAKAGAPEAFARYIDRRAPRHQRWRAIVGHCDARVDGERLLEALRRRLDLEQAWLVETGPALGAHAGRGALLVSLQPVPGSAA